MGSAPCLLALRGLVKEIIRGDFSELKQDGAR